MTITKNNVKQVVRSIETTTMLCGHDAKYYEEGNEYVIRYEDGNNFTISIYITEFETIFGYLLEDGTYKWYATSKNSQFKKFADYMFFIGCKLMDIKYYIENYVID